MVAPITIFVTGISLILHLRTISCCSNTILAKNMQSTTPESQQGEAVSQLIRRLIGERSKEFTVKINKSLYNRNGGCDLATVTSGTDNTVIIEGSSGVAAARAFHNYLRNKCNGHISWEHTRLNLPQLLPKANFTVKASDPIRYYQNVCAYGYSYVWWKWPEFEKHIDWMAMNGLNLILTSSGQEAVWLETMVQFGMSKEETLKYFTGPAFLPWNRMGNLFGWGGPMPKSWLEQDKILQHKILERIRSLGMFSVIPAFNGIVPERIIQLHPNITSYRLRNWGHFDNNYTGSFLLDITSSLMEDISRDFHDRYSKEFGGDAHFYSLDTFNEMSPPISSIKYLKKYVKTVSQLLKKNDNKAVWVLQGWMFRNTTFWREKRAKAFLKSIPLGRVLILDLASTTSPQFGRLKSYYGHYFVYCMLHNYGGTSGLYGKAVTVNEGPHAARYINGSSSMVGTGITPEGIHNSYVMYELMLESSWRNGPLKNLSSWFQNYTKRRYGKEEDSNIKNAWSHLYNSVFNCCANITAEKGIKEFRFHGKSVLTDLPSLTLKKNLWYVEEEVVLAWDDMVSGTEKINSSNNFCSNSSSSSSSIIKNCKNDPFIYDLVDVSRQAMANKLHTIYQNAISAYNNKDKDELIKYSSDFMDLLSDIDKLLGTCDWFLLGKWLEEREL